MCFSDAPSQVGQSVGGCEMESDSDEDEVLYSEAPRRVFFNPNIQQSTFELGGR